MALEAGEVIILNLRKEGNAMHWYDILKLIVGEATNVLPIFVKNPKSQQITGVILTEATHAVQVAQALGEAPNVAAAETAATHNPAPAA